MAGSVLRQNLSQRALARALLPYLLVQVAVMLLVLLWPSMIWHSHAAVSTNAASNLQLSDEEVQQVFEQQRRQNEKESN